MPGLVVEDDFFNVYLEGFVVKRPILAGEDFVLVGFKPAEWEARFGKNGGNG